MTREELQAKLTSADNAYIEKTGKRPYFPCSLSLSQNAPGWECYIYERNDRDGMGDRFSADLAESPEAAIDAFFAKIAALPSIEEANLREFQRSLGHLIDKGRYLGIDVAFVNPLAETAKRLSENALTFHKDDLT
ncbi:hypothetical protein [Salipiger thiooxidans]|uniref:hypothetical protein n=1 Tax=Salipiger thiooxidans TaxID=282683 RepID=UPI001CD4D6EB|nr:hypothetical protein [Salipiger thiooxidans]MCA0846086.1 hypothetical protein [Salipiger thiooxidans]